MSSQCTLNSRPYSPKLELERKPVVSAVRNANNVVAADIEQKFTPNRPWSSDVRLQISSVSWLKKFGLRTSNLDSHTLFPRLGFPRMEAFNETLHKPIHSLYGEKLFPKYFREDGVTYNIVVKKDKLVQARQQLENAIELYQQRLEWLSSESRRIFGVIEEQCVTIIIDVRNKNSREFDQFLCAIERLINEQLRHCLKFNIMRVQDETYQMATQLLPVSKDTISNAVDWLWRIERTAEVNASNLVEALIRALNCCDNAAVYLITEGLSSDGGREVFREKVKEMTIPFNIISYNCNNNPEYLSYLMNLVSITGGRFHTYAFNMEMNSFEAPPLEDTDPKANLMVVKKMYGGPVGGINKRQDCVMVFSELEEAKLILSQIKGIISQLPAKRVAYDDQDRSQNLNNDHITKEEYMSSKEWLSKFGLKARKLDLYDVLAGVCFRHCDGVIDVYNAPENIDWMEQQDALLQQKLVNAKYCDKFAHVRWKDGTLVHVQMSADVHRLYCERMNICLTAIKRRIEWLRQGSRELFGTIMEDDVYVLIDTSASMEPHIGFVKDKLHCLILEQLKHKSSINFVAFNSKALPWRDRSVDVTESNLKAAWHWLEGLTCQGSTNTLQALQFAIKDRKCQGIYLLSDGRPDHPAKTIISQIRLQHRLPIHTISFNCSDLEANTFLSDLAKETGGRFHYFNEISGGSDSTDEHGLEAWESEDVRLLKEEYKLGSDFVDKVTKLRDECHRLAWQKEISAKMDQRSARKTMAPVSRKSYSGDYRAGDRVISPVSPRRIQARNSFKKIKDAALDPLWQGEIKLLEFQKPADSFVPPLQTLSASKEESWILPETRGMLQRQTDRYWDGLDKLKQHPTRSHRKGRRSKHSTSLKRWLDIHGLVPQHMTILDVLSPTIIKIKPSHAAGIEKDVISKVFADILPVSHIVADGGGQEDFEPVVKLVNPLTCDLKGYQDRLLRLLNDYHRKLSDLIKSNIGSECVNDFEQLVKDKGLANEEVKRFICDKFKDADWPVSQQDLENLLQEIYLANKYFSQAGELMKIQPYAAETVENFQHRKESDEVSLPLSANTTRSSMNFDDSIKSTSSKRRSSKQKLKSIDDSVPS